MIAKRRIDLNQYLPQVIGDAKEIRAMQEAENPEFAMLWEEFVRFEKDVFVLTAEEYGIRRWVDLMELDVSQMSLEEQRALVILKLNENIPYTDRTLRKILDVFLGVDGYTLEIDYRSYRLVVHVIGKSIAIYSKVQDLMERIKPANLTDEVVLLFEKNMPLHYAFAQKINCKELVLPYRLRRSEKHLQYVAMHLRQKHKRIFSIPLPDEENRRLAAERIAFASKYGSNRKKYDKAVFKRNGLILDGGNAHSWRERVILEGAKIWSE